MQKLRIDLKFGQKIFLTSDLHDGHKNILNFCCRPFVDTKDMTKHLIENWNSVVGKDDIVFDLGDMFWFESRHAIKRFVEQLNGHIYKIPGNHDMDCKRLFELCDPNKVTVCDDIVVVYVTNIVPYKPDKPVEFVLCHFPLATWPHWGNGVPQFFGHIHSGPLAHAEIDVPGKDLTLKEKLQYDVGADNNDFTPIELSEAYSKMGRDFDWNPGLCLSHS